MKTEIPQVTVKMTLALLILEEGPRSPESLNQKMHERWIIRYQDSQKNQDAFVSNMLSRKLIAWAGADNRILVLAPSGRDQLRLCRELLRKE